MKSIYDEDAVYVLCYTDSNGHLKHNTLFKDKDVDAWTRILDEGISKGIYGEYIITKVDRVDLDLAREMYEAEEEDTEDD